MKFIRGARGVATAAALGNLLQGWDGGAIAGDGKETHTHRNFPVALRTDPPCGVVPRV